MVAIGGVALLFLLIVFIITMRGTSEANEIKEQKEQLNLLDSKLTAKRTELLSIEQQLQNRSIDRTSNLSNVVNETLDIYEQSNIKIPIDIIEDLQFMNLTDNKQVFDYIENQRNYWTLENRKKPYRRL